MDYWPSLIKRFLLNQCAPEERKMVFHALRDGWIDDLFLDAISEIMSGQTEECVEIQSGKLLKEIRRKVEYRREKEPVKRKNLREFLKIASVILLTLSCVWMYRMVSEKQPVQTAMNTLTVPAGQTVHLTLSDGTGIWLNSRSVLKYSGIFTGEAREVILDGEAFFEVKPGKKPFLVHTGNYDIQVLGTHFNVEAYSHSEDFITSLLEGSVKITSVRDTGDILILQPNTLARSQGGRLVCEQIDDFEHFRWRDGLISFRDIKFPELMKKFEKCYGIKIVVENEQAHNYTCTGKFRQSDGIDYALRVLQRDLPFRYVRDDEELVIYIK